MVAKAVKSIIFVVLSVFTIYFLNGFIPKIINLLSDGYERTFVIVAYWIAMFSVLVFPQYWVWFTEEDIDIISPLKYYVAFAISISAIVFVTLIVERIFNALIYSSSTYGMIFAICFWLFAILVLYVPQIWVWQPIQDNLKESGYL